jgi:anthranilate synthase/aminodeoxychorismate synthase-like glutamine amidotransferase
VDDFCKRNCDAKVYRSDIPLDELKKIAEEFEPDMLLISPGPGTPDSAGISLAAVDYFKDKMPIFGVCLGHQTIVQYFGGKIGHAPEPMHGKGSRVVHTNKGVFKDVENPLQAGRYHSLCAHAETLPDCLEKTAEFEGVIMGVQHKNLPIYGVQFHPESILTPAGGKIIENMLKIATEKGKDI